MPENEDEFTVDVLYNILCRQESSDVPLPARVQDVVSRYVEQGKNTDAIPCTEFFAPKTIDFTHAKYICIGGLYHSYLLIPSDGYKSRVTAGWLSLLVNAGDGIDIDLYLAKQPKERMVHKLGQQLRINRSKIKETSDTNTDFDDLDGAIRSGYFLKDGLANNEDFYYMNLLITITAETPEDLAWREREMKKLLVSQDLAVSACSFREEQAFLSALPLTSLEKHLFGRSKRNVLTAGAASCYPFTAFELCDDNGILLGTNKINNSLVIVDIFNSKVYKNANMANPRNQRRGKNLYHAAHGAADAAPRVSRCLSSRLSKAMSFTGPAKTSAASSFKSVRRQKIASMLWRFGRLIHRWTNCWKAAPWKSRRWRPKSSSCTSSFLF